MGLVYENLGVVYIKMGQWREARDALAEAIRRSPDSPEAHYNLGLVYGKLKRDQEARAQFAEAVRLAPNMAKAHKNLGLAYLNLGLLDQARKSLQEAARLDPTDPQAHYALCVYYARAGDTQAANREFQALKGLDPKLADNSLTRYAPAPPARSRESGWRYSLDKLIPKTNQKTIICHSERSEESLFIKPPRFFTKLSSIQNDMNIQYPLTATSYEMPRCP